MKFKVFAEFRNPADRKYNPEWEAEIEAGTIGDAQAEGVSLFQEYCDETGLDVGLYEVHASTS